MKIIPCEFKKTVGITMLAIKRLCLLWNLFIFYCLFFRLRNVVVDSGLINSYKPIQRIFIMSGTPPISHTAGFCSSVHAAPTFSWYINSYCYLTAKRILGIHRHLREFSNLMLNCCIQWGRVSIMLSNFFFKYLML